MMSDRNPEASPEPIPDVRAQLARRLAIAGTLVAVLLGLLAIFDRLSQPDDEDPVPVYTQPVPVAPPKLLTQPVTPAVEEEAAAVETPAEEGAQIVDNPPPPEVAVVPQAPATHSVAAPVRVVPPQTQAGTEVEAVPETTSPTPLLPASPTPSARVLRTTPAAAPTPERAAAGAPRLFSGFVLQAGVFNSAQRAEELHAKLTLNGVPSQIETRVQVGPFRTRAEALAAQAQLRDLGIESILVRPKGQR